jgi:hypothetical protein
MKDGDSLCLYQDEKMFVLILWYVISLKPLLHPENISSGEKFQIHVFPCIIRPI